MEIKTKYNIGNKVLCLHETERIIYYGEIDEINIYVNTYNEIKVEYTVILGKGNLFMREENVFKNTEDLLNNIENNFNKYFKEK